MCSLDFWSHFVLLIDTINMIQQHNNKILPHLLLYLIIGNTKLPLNQLQPLKHNPNLIQPPPLIRRPQLDLLPAPKQLLPLLHLNLPHKPSQPHPLKLPRIVLSLLLRQFLLEVELHRRRLELVGGGHEQLAQTGDTEGQVDAAVAR